MLSNRFFSPGGTVELVPRSSRSWSSLRPPDRPTANDSARATTSESRSRFVASLAAMGSGGGVIVSDGVGQRREDRSEAVYETGVAASEVHRLPCTYCERTAEHLQYQVAAGERLGQRGGKFADTVEQST